MRKSFGFTMIEILVVVAIIGILSVIGMDNFFFSQKKARDAQRKSDLSGVVKALELFNHDNGKYPISDTGMVVGCDGEDGLVACVWDGKTPFKVGNTVYIAKMPKDPEQSYTYYYSSVDGKTFGLYAHLENPSDPANHVAGIADTDCGSAVKCNYYVSESGVEMP